MSLKIQTAELKDLKKIQDLNHELFLSDFSSDPALDLDWPYKEGESYFGNLIKCEDGLVLLALEGSKIVGYLAGSVQQTESFRPIKVAELENMLVLEGYRSQGIGSELIKEFSAWAKKQGSSKCSVEVYSPNKQAISFYMKNGFEPYYEVLELDLDQT